MDLKKIKELSNKYYMNVFHRQNICFVRGNGNKLYDTTGKEYTDFVSGIGVNCLGYNNPDLTKAISEVIRTPFYIHNDCECAGSEWKTQKSK